MTKNFDLLFGVCSVMFFSISADSANGVVSDFENYANEVRPDGVSLLSFVKPFKEYHEPNLEREEMIRVIVVGAVLNPGIYYVKKGAALQNVVNSAQPISIDGFETKAYRNYIILYRIGAKEEPVKMSKEGDAVANDRPCLEGDVLKVRAVRF